MLLSPAPFRKIVSSFVMVMLAAEPSRSAVVFSSLMSSSSVKTVPPVRMARSPRIDLRLSPKPWSPHQLIVRTGPCDMLTWCFHSTYLKLSAQFVQDARCKRFAIDVFSNNEQRSSLLRCNLQARQDVADQGDLLFTKQDDRLFELGFLSFDVGDEVCAGRKSY